VLTADDKLFLLTSDADLFVAKASGAAFEQTRRYKVATSSTYAHPVIAGKNILIKDSENPTLWSLE
jgi:hypothetical protein